MPVLETPSRVWRRIQAADDLSVPSLPSLPGIDDNDDVEEDSLPLKPLQPNHSASFSVKRSTTVRFAEVHESFEFSDIQPITHQSILSEDDGEKLPVDYSANLSSHLTPARREPTVNNITPRGVRTPSLTRSASLVSTSPDNTPPINAPLNISNASKRLSTSIREQSIQHSPANESKGQLSKHTVSILQTSLKAEDYSEQFQQPNDTQDGSNTTSHIDPHATPQARKRSFLLDVIHSGAKPRPRLSMHTPLRFVQTPQKEIKLQTPLLAITPKPAVNESFVSTASSHDLTVHHPRVNSSFDHVTGARAVGRFNATKLNTYLNGLNRRLVEENEQLTAQLKRLQAGQPTITEVDESTRALEIDALESMVKDLQDQLEREKEEKETEKLKFSERVKSVEEDVNQVVAQLEKQLEESEHEKEQALVKVRRAEDSREAAEARAHRAELALAKMTASIRSPKRNIIGSPTGSGTASADNEEFKEAIERVAFLEEELRISSERCEALEEELKGVDGAFEELRIEKQASDARLSALRDQMDEFGGESQERLHELESELQESNERAEGLLAELAETQEELLAAQTEAESAKVDVEVLRERINVLEVRYERIEKTSRQMEEALETGDTKAMQDQEEISSLRREVQRLRLVSSVGAPSARASTNTAVSIHPVASAISIPGTADDIEALEKELDDAHREIGRLQHLLADSPARKALAEAQSAKIDAMQRENSELEERIRTLRVLLSKGSDGANIGTPLGRNASILDPGLTPNVRNLPSLRVPKTPGGPLTELSWLQTTHHPEESPYLRQISMLERELAHANENVDDKIDKLEEYGRGVLGLTNKLVGAESRVEFLQGEVKRLERRENRRARRALKGVACHNCGDTIELQSVLGLGDQSSIDATGTGDTTSNDGMKKALQQLEKMKQEWLHEKMRLEGEREYLQGAANRLDQELGQAQKDQDTQKMVLSELDQARKSISELETQLQSERTRLKAITKERNRMINDKDGIASELQRAQADLETVQEQLRCCKQENYALEADLRANAIAESKSRHLQNKVAQNQALIDQLRQERDKLADSHSALQQRHASASDKVSKLRKELVDIQSLHDDRRHQLDVQIAEIDDLRREIAWKEEELDSQRRQKAGEGELSVAVEGLEAQVMRLKADAEYFHQDLAALRTSKESSENRLREETVRSGRIQNQLRAQLHTVEKQLEEQRFATQHLREDHVCTSGDEGTLSRLKVQHNRECKGLMLQIGYLKSKYTRENTFRQQLVYQKEYLLLLLSRLQAGNQPILAKIAALDGVPTNSCRKSFRSIVQTIIFLNRAKRLANNWHEINATKDVMTVALQEVRKRRSLAQGRRSGSDVDNLRYTGRCDD